MAQFRRQEAVAHDVARGRQDEARGRQDEAGAQERHAVSCGPGIQK